MKRELIIKEKFAIGFAAAILMVATMAIIGFRVHNKRNAVVATLNESLIPAANCAKEVATAANTSRLLFVNYFYSTAGERIAIRAQLAQLHDEEYPALRLRMSQLAKEISYECSEIWRQADALIRDSLFTLQRRTLAQVSVALGEVDPATPNTPLFVDAREELRRHAMGAAASLDQLAAIIDAERDAAMELSRATASKSATALACFAVVFLATLAAAWAGIIKFAIKPVMRIREYLLEMSRGSIITIDDYTTGDEIGDMYRSLRNLSNSLRTKSDLAAELGKGNFDVEMETLSDDDILGNSLLKMRDDLRRTQEEDERRKREDNIRGWTTQGLAKFGDILRRNANIDELSYLVVENLLDYIGAIQGALYIVDDTDENDKHFRMTAAVAYGRRKLADRRYGLQEGLLGRCAFEQDTVYLKRVPDDYVRITSGLGDDNPTVLLLVPLKNNGVVYGIIELAAFTPFEDHQVTFLEAVSENIAGTLATAKINEKTAHLLAESQIKGQELTEQEEMMRQNMEELRATQEESARREGEMMQIITAISNTLGSIETDTDGVILNTNDKMPEILGMKADELVGRGHKTLVKLNAKQEQLYTEMWNEFGFGAVAEMDQCYPCPNGDVWTRETYTPVRNDDGEVVKIIILSADITDNKTKDRAIHAYKREIDEQGNSLKQVIEQMNQMKASLDQREREILKEKEIAEEESRVQIESMQLQIEDLESRLLENQSPTDAS